jgi:LacI family transcriptional regulator
VAQLGTPGNTTLRDVAEQVGVSIRTVSRVVNNETGFSEATRSRVLDAVESLGYRPNLLARGLIKGRSGTVALVATELTDPFFPELAEGVQNAANELGLTLLVASTANNAARQATVLESLRSHAVDGLILFPTAGTERDVVAVAASGLPTVAIDARWKAPGLVSVTSDIYDGARIATRHLVDGGRTCIAMISSVFSEQRTREAGYVDELTGVGHPIIERVDVTAAGGITAVEALLARHPNIDAIFAYNDLMAVGALKALRDAGRSVPGDVAVVGFDNIGLSEFVTPALTTIRIDRERLGREAINQLSTLMDNQAYSPELVELPVSLVVRESA